MKSYIMLVCIQVHQIEDMMGGTCRTHGRYDKLIFFFNAFHTVVLEKLTY